MAAQTFGLIALLVGTLGGVSLLVWGLHRLTGIGTWAEEGGHSFGRFLLYFNGFLLALGVAGLSGPAAGVPFFQSFLMAAGVGFIVLAWRTPWWFWDQPLVADLRSILGDVLVRLLYVAIAVGLLYLGLFADPVRTVQ